MKKLLFFSFLAISLIGMTKAQFSVGLSVGQFKFTDAEDGMNGFNINASYELNDNSRVGLNIGNYQESVDVFGITIKTGIRPITVFYQGDVNVSDKFKPYYGAELGMYSVFASIGDESNSEGYLGFAGVGGARYFLADNVALNLGIKYHTISFEGELDGALGLNLGVDYKF